MSTTLTIYPSTHPIVQFVIREVLQAPGSLPLVSRPCSHSAHSTYTWPMSFTFLYPPLFRLECHLEQCPTTLGQCHCGHCYYPQPHHQSCLKMSIRQKAAYPQKYDFHWSMQAQSRWSSDNKHTRPSLSSPTTSVHLVGGSYSQAGYFDSSQSFAHIWSLIPLGFSGLLDGQWNHPLTECPCPEPTTILATTIYLYIINEKSGRKAISMRKAWEKQNKWE